MKVILLSLIAVLVVSFSSNKKRTFVPPGTVQINEHFFVDEFEITNLAWQEYVHWNARHYGAGSPGHLQTLADTTVWLDPKAYSAPYATYYHKHAAYRAFPVVGITREQAEAFCKWRTLRVKEWYSRKYHKDLNIEYRLPSESEWEFIAADASLILTNNGLDEKGQPRLNCLVIDTTDGSNFGDVLAPVKSYRKNGFGVYNMLGNAAEMVQVAGIAKGGSWRHLPEDCRPGKNISYSGPQSWLGFRCVCVVDDL